ncbi:IS630 family transposase [Spirosoma fluminis]
MEDVLAVYEQVPQAGRVGLCFDERPCQLLDDMVACLPAKPGQVVKEDKEYIRKGTAVVLLAYDLDSGQRYVQVRERRTKADYTQFIQKLVHTQYADAELIEVVQDNLNTHKYGSFYEHLPATQARALSRRLAFHFTLEHGSWLNMAKIEFSALARQCLNRRIGSLKELSRQTALWATACNQRAVKVHWSFTVTRAVDKLKRWYERVNPANRSDSCKH